MYERVRWTCVFHGMKNQEMLKVQLLSGALWPVTVTFRNLMLKEVEYHGTDISSVLYLMGNEWMLTVPCSFSN